MYSLGKYGVIEDTDSAEKILDDADGSGLALIKILKERYNNSSPADKAVVSSNYTNTITKGPLRARRPPTPTSRPTSG